MSPIPFCNPSISSLLPLPAHSLTITPDAKRLATLRAEGETLVKWRAPMLIPMDPTHSEVKLEADGPQGRLKGWPACQNQIGWHEERNVSTLHGRSYSPNRITWGGGEQSQCSPTCSSALPPFSSFLSSPPPVCLLLQPTLAGSKGLSRHICSL